MDVSRPIVLIADRVRSAAGIVGDAIRIAGGKITAVGRAADLRSSAAVEERYAGAVIVPGLVDAHFHPTGYAAALTRLNLSGARDETTLRDLIREAERSLPEDGPIIGTRLDDEHLDGGLPDRVRLDAICAGRPVLLYRYCGHIAVANTAALAAAGIDPDTADPPGGSLDRDRQGVPTGVLRETAVELVARHVGTRAADLGVEELLRSLRGLVTQGITRLGAMITVEDGLWCGIGRELDLLLAAAPDLPLDLHVLLIADEPRQVEAAAAQIASAGRRLHFLGVKAFADGSLGGHTAAMRSGYADRPDTRGTLRFDRARIDPLARRCLELGGTVAIHAIGDLANATVIDYFRHLRDGGAGPESLRVEHASVLADEDIVRLAETGAVASVQPAFLASEADWLEKRLGSGRLANTYPLRTMLDAGIPLAGGSDCPVEPPDPLAGMAAARDRAGLVPAERLDGAAALGLFTDGAAAAVRAPAPLGIGSPAHLTILDADPVDATPDELRRCRVLSTWLDGEPQRFDPDALVWE